MTRYSGSVLLAVGVLTGSLLIAARSDEPPRDPAAEAVKVQPVPAERPEQRLTEHDKSGKFDPTKPAPVTPALKDQPKAGRITGFDFARDPLNAPEPFTTFDEVM